MKIQIYLIRLLIVSFLILLMNPYQTKAQNTTMKKTDKVPANKEHLFEIQTNEDINPIIELAEKIFKLTPPLHPERLARRMKMLWGIDIKDYPADCLINLGGNEEFGYLLFSPSNGLIQMKTFQHSPLLGDNIPKSFPPEKYSLFYRYIMMSDLNALEEYYDKYGETFTDPYQILDFVRNEYCEAIFDSRESIIEHTDKNLHDILLAPTSGYYRSYVSNRRLDAIFLYILKEMKKDRKLYFSKYDENRESSTINDIYVQEDPIYKASKFNSEILSFLSYGEEEENNPWYPMLHEKSVAASWIAFQLKLNIDSIDKRIVKDLHKKYTNPLHQKRMSNFKEELENNNYYGHTLVREFLNNPMREMPTSKKIGTSFAAKISIPKVLLYLEPSEESFNIDTIKASEHFIAYETGHDDYFFIEIEKPIESPIAGADGYARILDKKEIVQGYVKKSSVAIYTDSDILSEPGYTNINKSKTGIIIDPDGYVNIRKERSTKAGITGKITDKETFHYWEIEDGNWYIVQTQKGLRGFVYKDRIKEKKDYNGWVLED